MPSQATQSRPRILLRQSDADRLSDLALRIEAANPTLAGLILGEIERAQVRHDAKVPPGVVGVGSTVEFVDEAHGESRTVELVWPGEADIEAGRISVMTPVGAGLIGLAEGQSILWPDRDGKKRALRVVRVMAPLAVAG